jgi:hypothetical protein
LDNARLALPVQVATMELASRIREAIPLIVQKQNRIISGLLSELSHSAQRSLKAGVPFKDIEGEWDKSLEAFNLWHCQ